MFCMTWAFPINYDSSLTTDNETQELPAGAANSHSDELFHAAVGQRYQLTMILLMMMLLLDV
jgi:hypothetical protein